MKLAELNAWMASRDDIMVGLRWGNPTWLVQERMLCWRRSFSKADLRRFEAAGVTPPAGEIVALAVSSLEEKEALLFASLPGFFTIPHFDGYPAVLVALDEARVEDVTPILERMRHWLTSKPAARARAPAAARSSSRPKATEKKKKKGKAKKGKAKKLRA